MMKTINDDLQSMIYIILHIFLIGTYNVKGPLTMAYQQMGSRYGLHTQFHICTENLPATVKGVLKEWHLMKAYEIIWI